MSQVWGTGSRRECLRAGAAWALGLGFGLAGHGGRGRRAGGIALWAADRAGHSVSGLDADGLLVARVPVLAPTAVAPATQGLLAGVDPGMSVCWVEHVPGALGSAPAALAPRSFLRVELDQAAGQVHTRRVEEWGERLLAASALAGEALPKELLPLVPGAIRWAPDIGARGHLQGYGEPRAGWVLLGHQDPRSPGEPARLERWVLGRHRSRGGGQGRKPSLHWRRAFRFHLDWSARSLVADASGIWVAADRQSSMVRFSHTGHLAHRGSFPDADGVSCLALTPSARGTHDSGVAVWAAAGGALVRWDQQGRRLPGQGGFCHLVSVAPVSSLPHSL